MESANQLQNGLISVTNNNLRKTVTKNEEKENGERQLVYFSFFAREITMLQIRQLKIMRNKVHSGAGIIQNLHVQELKSEKI